MLLDHWMIGQAILELTLLLATELDTGFLADSYLKSKLLQKTPVAKNASESNEGRCGHKVSVPLVLDERPLRRFPRNYIKFFSKPTLD